MRSLLRGLVLIALGLTTGGLAAAQELTKIRFTLDWKIQGLHAWYYWAQDKGYFAAEKLDVTIDQGEGSAATVTRVMSGAYDAGFGDVNAIIQTAAQKPGAAPVFVFMIYSNAPFALLAKRPGPIETVGDLKGRRLGAPAGGAAVKLFPALARKNNLDPATVSVTNIVPSLQEQMLLQDQIDALAAFTATSYMNLVALKRDPDKDFRWIYYADGGLDLYSNGVMVSAALAKGKPEAVRGLVRAIAKAMREVVANPDAAVELLAAKEPLIDKSIEKRRLLYVLRTLIDTPEARALGVGDIDDARMARAVTTMVEAYELPRAPAVGEVFDRAFLPAKAERTL
ncbi:MAG TPA: ABC transporter substrate-binding protein, partial [Xanthobacteraceae bacterium]|nr:ABC transporter substrate-binding protein [Xanthobacteraceae bacterium]